MRLLFPQLEQSLAENARELEVVEKELEAMEVCCCVQRTCLSPVMLREW